MQRLAIRIGWVLLVTALLAGVLGNHADARTLGARAGATVQPTEVLIWQGKVLPIVTDVFASISALNVALQNRNIDAVAKVGDEFAGERIRFTQITPTPRQVKAISTMFVGSLRDMSDGTKALVIGLRANSNTNAQRAATQIVNGLKNFQKAVDQVRRNSGPFGEPTVVPTNAGPAPTPIIKGLP